MSYPQQKILWKKFDVDRLSVSEIKQLDTGAKICSVLYNHEELGLVRPVIQSPPKMVSKFGLDIFQQDGGTQKWNLGISFDGMDDNESILGFFNMMVSLDNKIKQFARDNCKEWFKKNKISDEVIDDKYSSLVKYSRDKSTGEIIEKYKPTYRVQIIQSGKSKTEVFDKKKESMPLEETLSTKGLKVKCLFSLSCVWLNQGFGLSLKCNTIEAQKSDRIAGYSFVEDSDDSDGDGDGDEEEGEDGDGAEDDASDVGNEDDDVEESDDMIDDN
jgi:hypothetical protein